MDFSWSIFEFHISTSVYLYFDKNCMKYICTQGPGLQFSNTPEYVCALVLSQQKNIVQSQPCVWGFAELGLVINALIPPSTVALLLLKEGFRRVELWQAGLCCVILTVRKSSMLFLFFLGAAMGPMYIRLALATFPVEIEISSSWGIDLKLMFLHFRVPQVIWLLRLQEGSPSKTAWCTVGKST